MAVWLRGLLWLPSQDDRMLRIVNPQADWAEQGELPLPGRVVQALALAEGAAWVGLLDDGRVLLADRVRAARPATR